MEKLEDIGDLVSQKHSYTEQDSIGMEEWTQ